MRRWGGGDFFSLGCTVSFVFGLFVGRLVSLIGCFWFRHWCVCSLDFVILLCIFCFVRFGYLVVCCAEVLR